MKKRIGIVSWKTTGDSVGITAPYYNFIKRFGQVVILTPGQIDLTLDLLILPGGPDISAYHYNNDEPSVYNGNNCSFREFFFKNSLPVYIENKIPIFGICLGMQQIAVHFGIPLIQHYAFPYSSNRTDREEKLSIINSEIWTHHFDISGKSINEISKDYKVNSMHHQGVHIDSLNENIVPLAISANCKNIEILMHKELPIIGVQYHPEEINDFLSTVLIKKLLQNVQQ